MSFASQLGALTRELVEVLAPPSVQVRFASLSELLRRYSSACDDAITTCPDVITRQTPQSLIKSAMLC